MNIFPLEDRVIILQDDVKKETESGLAIPEIAQQKPSAGVIVRVGPGKPKNEVSPIGYLWNDVFHQTMDGQVVNINDRIVPVYEMPLKEGDHVLYSFYAGQEVEYEGKKYIVMRFSDVIARV